MYMFPLTSIATWLGIFKLALVAGPSSPLKPNMPFPATVVMIPVSAATCLIRLFTLSIISRLPLASIATRYGYAKLALVAGPPSPLKPSTLFPATVVIIPKLSILRIL